MTPKEKAKELVDKYFKLLNYEFGDLVYSLSDKQPHQCALIAIDEVIKALRKDLPEIGLGKGYWASVKQEIEKL
jgi:hypothetical protein